MKTALDKRQDKKMPAKELASDIKADKKELAKKQGAKTVLHSAYRGKT